MSETDEASVYKFSKEVYRDRRNKGYTGQVHPPGSKQQRYDQRRMFRAMRKDQLAKLRKGKNESAKGKTT